MSVPVQNWLFVVYRKLAFRHGGTKGAHQARHRAAILQSAFQHPRAPSDRPKVVSTASHKTPYTQPFEPLLFPKLRNYFADFPYLQYSIDQRLFTLET